MRPVIAMRLFIGTAFVLLFVVAYATPEAEDDARLKIKAAFSVAESFMEELHGDLHSKHSDRWLLAVKPLARSFDQECVFQKYKKFDMFDELLNEEKIVPKIMQMLTDPAKDKRMARLGAIGVTCSSKINPFLNFVFW